MLLVLLFNAIVFGGFVGFLTDYWLGRATVKDPKKLIIALIVGVITGVLVFVGKLGVF